MSFGCLKMSSTEEISSTAKSVESTKHNLRASVSSSNTLLNTPPPLPAWNNVIDHDYFNSFPPGYRFNPSDKELILSYLKPKLDNQTLPKHRIVEANLYQYNPQDLADEYKECGESEWYFFTPRDRKYRNGFRPKRAAGNGYWKATGADREVKSRDKIIGYRNSLVFYVGKAPKGDKTNWIMHEYRLNRPPAPANKRNPNDMRLDHWVLCRIYKKTERSHNKRSSDKKDVEVSSITHSDDPTGDFEGKTSFTDPASAAQNYCYNSFPLGAGISDPLDQVYSNLSIIESLDMPSYSSYSPPIDCKPTGPVVHLPVNANQLMDV